MKEITLQTIEIRKLYIIVNLMLISILSSTRVFAADSKDTSETLQYNQATSDYRFSNNNTISAVNIIDYVDEVEQHGTTPAMLTIKLKDGDNVVSVNKEASDTIVDSIGMLEGTDPNVRQYQITFKKLATTPKDEVGGVYAGEVEITIEDGLMHTTKTYTLLLGYAIYKRTAELQATIKDITYPEAFKVSWTSDAPNSAYLIVDGYTGPMPLDDLANWYSGSYGAIGTVKGIVDINEDEYYYYGKVEQNFTIHKGKTKISIPSDVKVGTTASIHPSATINTVSGVETLTSYPDVEFLYKKKSDPDVASSYSATVPTTAGTYTCKANLSDDFNPYYEAGKADFKVSYLATPNLVLSGKAGSNGYYTSDVTLKAPSGYALSTTFGSGYVDSLEYNNVSSKPYLYFKQKSTGALSDKVSMPAIKIDKVIPVINGVKNGDKLYETSRAIEVTDANLESVTVNGSAIPVSAGKASTTLSLEGSKKDFTIVAKDQAGLTVTYNVTLMSDWMRSGVIPGAGKVTLYKGTGYKLGAGKWKVSGDSTVYNGGGQFYVSSDKELTFSAE